MNNKELEQAKKVLEYLIKQGGDFKGCPDVKVAFTTALRYLERVGEMEKEILEDKEILEASYKDTQYFEGKCKEQRAELSKEKEKSLIMVKLLAQCQKRGVEHSKRLKEANADLARLRELTEDKLLYNHGYNKGYTDGLKGKEKQ